MGGVWLVGAGAPNTEYRFTKAMWLIRWVGWVGGPSNIEYRFTENWREGGRGAGSPNQYNTVE